MTTRTVEKIALPQSSPGTQRHLRVIRYGDPASGRKVYLQAALHADEIPGILVLNQLLERLDAADERGEISGHIVIVPFANPVGYAQYILGRLAGRYDFGTGINFNRNYPEVASAIADSIADELGDDPQKNIALIRSAALEWLAKQAPKSETDFLKNTLHRLAVDADLVLDLHCDFEAVLHVYTGTALWPDATDLCAQMGSETTLLASLSGGNPFDEAVSAIWWQLAERFPDKPIPNACLAATIEFRGEMDVNEQAAKLDAENLYKFLQRRAYLAGDPGPLPSPRCEATPLSAVAQLSAPHAGVISFTAEPGARLSAGDTYAMLIDPEGERPKMELQTEFEGIFFARTVARLVHPGQSLGKIAGKTPIASEDGGRLLAD